MKKHILPLSIITVCLLIFAMFVSYKLIMPLNIFDAYTKMIICIVAVISLLIYLLYYLVFVVKAPMHKCYLPIGLVFGVIFMFIIPPYVTPDEPNHIWSTYYVSNVMLGYGEPSDPNATMVVRTCEATAPLNHIVARETYNTILNNIFSVTDANGNILVDSYSPYSTPHALYIIPAIGVTIGRVLSLSAITSLLLGTLCNMLFFVGSAYYAIKKVPFGKMIMIAFCLLPMSLQQTSSFSYDNALLSSSVVVIALGLKWCFSDDKPTRSELVIYMIYSALLIMGKGGVYCTLCFLPVLYGLSKEKISRLWTNYRKPILFFVVMLFLIMFTGKFGEALNSEAVTTPETTVESSGEGEVQEDVYIVGWAGEEGYTLSWALQNPLETIRVFAVTVMLNWKYYVLTLYGNSLGWFQIGIPSILIWCYIGIALLATISERGEERFLSMKDRVWVSLCSLASCGLCALAMFLFWSPKSYGVILGLQGRYFLPPYLAMMYCLRNKKIALKWNMDRVLLMANVVITTGAITCVLRHFCG